MKQGSFRKVNVNNKNSGSVNSEKNTEEKTI